jgi:CBS domain-containing protein
MPYSVEQLIENQSLITIHEEELVTTAIELMIEHDYSQLPVIDQEGKLIGLLTY